ncbi:hypothetical protein [Aquitalea palustris]|uniref:hypothetical protein n=1 Tax=Aquitalea palustris TaxID=2480983 RepID=UPI001CF0C957|nr:hypothetical protein [Aquitalea palustris]
MVFLLPILIATAVGTVGYSGITTWLAAAPFVAIAWGMACSRLQAFLIMLGYYLAVGRGLFHGGGVFFAGEDSATAHSLWWGLAVWVGPSLILAFTWAACWNRNSAYWRLLLAVVLVGIPPIGLIGWASPAAAAGIWFPGLGWAGLGLMLLSMVALAKIGQQWRLQ